MGSAISRKTVFLWIEKFKIDRTRVTHEELDGRPSTCTIDVNIQQAREMVLAKRRFNIDEVAAVLNNSLS